MNHSPCSIRLDSQSSRGDNIASVGTEKNARQSFQHSRTSLGVAGHWLHLLAVLSPLVIGETIKDPEKKWRAIRLASVGTAIATEALWTHRLLRKQEEEQSRQR